MNPGADAHPAIALKAALTVAAEKAEADGVPDSLRRHVREGLGRAGLLIEPDLDDTLLQAGETLECEECGERDRFGRRIVYAHDDLIDAGGVIREYDAGIEEYDAGAGHGFFCQNCGCAVVPMSEEERREYLADEPAKTQES